MSVTQIMQQYQAILEQEVPRLARETGAVKRVRKNGLDAVPLVETVIFGFWQEPDLPLSGLAQVAGRREVAVTESAISQRFSPACAALFYQVLQRLTEVQLASEKVEVPLLKQLSAVIVEDSSTITLPVELACFWRGCGGAAGMSEAAVKLFVRSYVLSGQVLGPRLTDGRTNDHQSPFSEQELPAGSLYLADLGFFGTKHLQEIARRKQGKRYFLTRWQPKTALYTRSGHRLDLRGLLAQQIGQVRELGVILGEKQGLAVRLLMVRLPEEVVKERQQRLRRAAQKHGREPSQEVLYLANWTIVLTHLPSNRADYSQVFVLLRLRWQIEIVQSQLTKTNLFTGGGGGDHITDLHLCFSHHNAINKQLDQLPFLLKGRLS